MITGIDIEEVASPPEPIDPDIYLRVAVYLRGFEDGKDYMRRLLYPTPRGCIGKEENSYEL